MRLFWKTKINSDSIFMRYGEANTARKTGIFCFDKNKYLIYFNSFNVFLI